MALKTFTGTIIKLNTRKVDGRNGPITAYSAKIAKPDGEEYDEWVGFGFKRPECGEGDEVVITAKKEGGFWKAVDVEVTKEAPQGGDEDSASGEAGSGKTSASSAPPASSSTPATPATQKVSSWKPKDPAETKAIHYQNSRSAALELVGLLIKTDALPVAATAGKAGKAKRFEEITALVNKLTVVLFNDLTTYRLLADVEDSYRKPRAGEGLPPDFDVTDEQADPSSDDDE